MNTIALIAGTYRPNHCGVAHYTHHLRQALHQRTIDSVVLTTRAAAQGLSTFDVVGTVEDWCLQQLPSLVKAIHSTPADILHIQHAAGTYGFDRSLFLLPLLLKLTGYRTPIVTTVHEYGWWEWQPDWIPIQFLEKLKIWGQNRYWWDREDGFLLTGSDAIITTNSDAKKTIHSRLPQLENIYQIPIAANIVVSDQSPALARQRVRQKERWESDTSVIAFFGFLHPVKGIETLLPAFKQVLKNHPKARLLLIGGVESLALPKEQAKQYWENLEQPIVRLELSEAVHMTGYLDEVAASECLKGSDVGVLPFNHGVTLKSGSLLALMAHSLPVIATRPPNSDPGFDERLVEFVSPRSVEELATALAHLLNNAERRQKMGQAGYQFSQQFNWAGIAEAHRAVYDTVLAKTRVARSRFAT